MVTFYYYFLSNEAKDFNALDEEYPKRSAFYDVPSLMEFIGGSLDNYYALANPTETDLIANYTINDPPDDPNSTKYKEATASVLYWSKKIR